MRCRPLAIRSIRGERRGAGRLCPAGAGILMGFVAKTIGSLPLAVVAITLGLGAPPSHAQNLFEILFGGGLNNSRRVESPQRPRVQRQHRSASPAPKITGPSYYTYKVDPLVRVDFAVLST